ncbi:MAG: hypothetical protein HY866_09095 [Chloroflexi bacterium]|nr:hypothetical protein [Chloroflexota bacterium]
MSLLRRVSRENDDDFDDEQDEEELAPPPPMAESGLHSLWTHVSGSKLVDLAITRDNRFVIAASGDGQLLFFDIAGRLLWNGRAQGKLYSLVLAEQSEHILIDSTNSAQLWNYGGRLVQTYTLEKNIQAICMTPDARLSLIADADSNLFAYTLDGQLVFQRKVDSAILGLKVSADGQYSFVGAKDHTLYAFDQAGNVRWTYVAQDEFSAGVYLAQEARCLVAGSNDHTVYALDFDGNALWQFDAGDAINHLAVTPDGSACLVATQAKVVYRLNNRGNVTWEYEALTALAAAALSDDGRFSLLGMGSGGFILVDHQQNHGLSEQKSRGKLHLGMLSRGGKLIVTVSADRTINAYRQIDLLDGSPELFTPENKTLVRLVVGQVREDFVINPHAGIMRWFTEFERSLTHHQFDLCQALLSAAHQENLLGLDEGEKQYTRSLEGAYWLLRGAAYHLAQHYDEARECYEQSKAIQERVNNQDGVGQVVAALSSLPEMSPTAAEGESPIAVAPALQVSARDLLDEIIARPRVLGLSEKVLEYRVAHATPAEQYEIVLLAKQSGLVAPLVEALNSSERVVRAAASAALALLDPGPDDALLAKMLVSPQSFVRWQAIRILRHRAHKNRDDMLTAKTQLWPLALTPPERDLQDTLVRREEALLVKELGEVDDMPWLLARLHDPDPDVTIAVIEALGVVGDRRALPELNRFPNRVGFLGANTQLAAKEAAANIEKRFPLPNIEKIVFCQDNPVRRISVPQSSLFLTDVEAVYCVVNLEHVNPGAQVKVQWKHKARVIHTETLEITDQPAQPVAAIRETPVVLPPPRPGGFFRRDSGPAANSDAPARPGRSPFGESDDDDADDRPAFGSRPGGLPSRPVFGSRPGSDESAPLRPGSSPFGARPGSNEPTPSRFGGSSPFGARPGSGTPADRPAPRFGASAPAPTRPDAPARPVFGERPPARFGAHPADAPVRRPSFLDRARPTDDDDNPFADPPPAANEDAAPPRPNPFSSRFGASRPALAAPPVEPEPTDPNPLRRLLNRQPPRRPFGGFGRSRFGSGDRPAPRPGSSPLPPLSPRPTTPSDRPPRPGENIPAWLSRLRDEPARPGATPPERPANPFARPSAPPANRDQEAPSRSPFSSAARPAPARKPGVKPYVFSLPTPEDGWQPETYQVEVTVDDQVKKQADFKFIDQIQLTGLEPGIAGTNIDKDFGRAQVFMTSARTIDCLAHLKEAPVSTPVTGKIYSVTSGTLLGEATASTQKQGQQAVQLSWQNTGWRPGFYRIAVSVRGGGEANTEIQLLHRFKVEDVVLCHQVDSQSGPVGTGWPFYSGDKCHCVLELEAPPPGVDIQADWYRAGDAKPIWQSKTYTTTPSGDQRAVFVLEKPGTLKPGHYSVVIRGKEMIRQERSFEVRPASLIRQVGHMVETTRQKAFPVIERFHLDTFVEAVIAVLLLGVVFRLLDMGTAETVPSSERARDAIFSFSHFLNYPVGQWAAGWGIFAGVYGVLHTRREHHLASKTEGEFDRAAALGLVFVVSGLGWYLMSYLVLGLGQLESENLLGLFEPLTLLAPFVAWLAPLVGMILAVRFWRQKQTRFYVALVDAGIIMLLLVVIGIVGAGIVGLLLGVFGAIIGEILHLLKVENDLGSAFIVAGVCAGFVFAPVAVAVNRIRSKQSDLIEQWQEEHKKRPQLDPLKYLLERSRIIISTDESNALIVASLRIASLTAAATLAAWIMLDPVVLPVMRWVYEMPQNSVLDALPVGFLALSVGALAVWPLLIHYVYTLILSPGLAPDERPSANRFRLVMSAAPLLWIAAATLLSRSAIWDHATLFWFNRLIALLLGALVMIGALLLIESLGEFERLNFKRENWPVEKIVLSVIVIVAGLLLPVWMWALLLGAGLLVIGVSARWLTQ